MENRKKEKGADGQPQTNLAEGEPDIVDESIRIHEEKGDLPAGEESDDEE
jgi:hypothetical protein